MLKRERAQIKKLKVEIMKCMKDEDKRVRELTKRNQREIQILYRKEKAAQERMKRLERTSEMQKIMLEKRQKEVLQTNGKLKSVMALLKRTTTPKSITKSFRNHKRQSVSSNSEGRKDSRRSSDSLSPIYDEVFVSYYDDKKKLLDEAIYKYISGRQTLAMMDEPIVKRNNLQEEKNELLEERKKIITNEIGNELGGDTQALDDKIEMINLEIDYVNVKIRSLQSSIAAEQEESSIKTDKAEKKICFILPEYATPEASYEYAVRILRNLDSFESYTILESFFKDIIELRTRDWSRQMTLEQQEKTISTLLDMRRAAVLTANEYERKNKELKEALRLGGRSSSPSTPEKRELQMDDIENSTSKAISLFEQTNEIQSSTPDVPTNPKRKDSGNSDFSSGSNNVKSMSSNGRILKRCPSTSSTSKDENISPSTELGNLHLECTRSLNSQPLKRTRSTGQLLERTKTGVQLSSSRRSSFCYGSTILAHSRRSSLLSDGPRDSGYFGSGDKRRSQSSMARRGSKDITIAYHMRQSSYGRSSSDSDDAREKRELTSHHTHIRSVTPTGDNVFDRLSKSQTQSSSAKNKYNGERCGNVASVTSAPSVNKGYEETLTALEGGSD
jgi:hypothetical protein